MGVLSQWGSRSDSVQSVNTQFKTNCKFVNLRCDRNVKTGHSSLTYIRMQSQGDVKCVSVFLGSQMYEAELVGGDKVTGRVNQSSDTCMKHNVCRRQHLSCWFWFPGFRFEISWIFKCKNHAAGESADLDKVVSYFFSVLSCLEMKGLVEKLSVTGCVSRS